MSCVRQGSSAGHAACSLCSSSLQQTTATQGQPRTLPGAGMGREGAFRQCLVQRVLRGISRMKDAQQLVFNQQNAKDSQKLQPSAQHWEKGVESIAQDFAPCD